MKNFLNKLFSVKYNNDYRHKVITFLGVKIKVRTNYYNKKSFSHLSEDIYNYITQADRTQEYKDLVRGLDFKSVQTVNNILSRIVKDIEDKDFSVEDDLTEEEKRMFNRCRNEFIPKILKLNENCYAWNKYIMPGRFFEASVLYYRHFVDTLSLNTLNQIKNKNIIDVGAFVGDSAVLLSDYTNEKVYTFEPVSGNYENVLKTIKLNDSKNIIPMKCGLGAKNEEVEIVNNRSESTIKINKFEFKNNDKEIIKIRTLDEIVQENSLQIGLIKVDIEGAEQDFLKGAENTIKTQKPALLLSIYHGADDFFHIKPILESWNLGYTFRIVKSPAGEPLHETLLICEILN